MPDIKQVRAMMKALPTDRDKLMVLLEIVTRLPLDRLRVVTAREAGDLLIGEEPLVKVTRAVLESYVKREALGPVALLFTSRKRDVRGNLQPLGRMQVWRVMRQAMESVHGDVPGTLEHLHGAVESQV